MPVDPSKAGFMLAPPEVATSASSASPDWAKTPTKVLAQENAKRGITVNAICAGYTATDMVRAMPQDVLERSILARRSPRVALGNRTRLPCRT
ncbi:SDR family oxidoreductase [Roseomonas chloroacetimidivorans]|uniref:SDR family oxidoreductase n=1 Tax=Roseomonas chloroacetimidivorans TaxID=1766656 RepID=UPI003C73C963